MMDAATRAAWEAGPFAKVLREAEIERERHRIEAAERAKALQNAAVWVDEDVSRDPTERAALAHLVEAAPNRDFGDHLMRQYAQQRLQQTWRGIDFEHFDWLREMGSVPRMRQPSLPKPVGDGRDWCKRPRKRHPVNRRPALDVSAWLIPLPLPLPSLIDRTPTMKRAALG